METKIIVPVLLGLLAAGSCQPPQPSPVYQSLEAEPQGEKQFGAFTVGVLTPTVATLAASALYNVGSAIINAFSATMAGVKLELISIESVLPTPIKESGPTPLDTPGGRPSKRRPYTRSMDHDDDKHL